MIDYVELIEKGKSSRKFLNGNEGEKRVKDRNEGKTSERKLPCLRVSPYLYHLGLTVWESPPPSAAISNTGDYRKRVTLYDCLGARELLI